ncbi:ScyD/ScyE family protein, partial [Georgenia sp. 10Sc9-8]|nr:ScyD/ScyE family protein [Georgenia halotolerans]
PGQAYDITATPSGSVLVGVDDTVHEITRSGLREVGVVPSPTPVNGLAARGARSAFAASAGVNEGAGAAVWQVNPGGARMIADIQAYEREHDPDVRQGSQWKDPECEVLPLPDGTIGSPGPQSNPYKLTRVSGDEVLLADAAGNTVLSVRQNGTVETVAVLDPPVDETGAWREFYTLADGTPCYVQPVPTAVAVGPDGAVYVGELTGEPAVPGWSRIWRIEPGARGVTCPSAECTVAFDGLTSVVDLEVAPDGDLIVVELEQAGWLAGPDEAVGGAVLTCTLGSGQCETVHAGLPTPNAVTVDKRGDVWLLENILGAEPTVRRLTMP